MGGLKMRDFGGRHKQMDPYGTVYSENLIMKGRQNEIIATVYLIIMFWNIK